MTIGLYFDTDFRAVELSFPRLFARSSHPSDIALALIFNVVRFPSLNPSPFHVMNLLCSHTITSDLMSTTLYNRKTSVRDVCRPNDMFSDGTLLAESRILWASLLLLRASIFRPSIRLRALYFCSPFKSRLSRAVYQTEGNLSHTMAFLMGRLNHIYPLVGQFLRFRLKQQSFSMAHILIFRSADGFSACLFNISGLWQQCAWLIPFPDY